MAQLGIPLPLHYWDRPWASAHIFEQCPVFSREWAGRDFKHPRKAKSVRQAGRHTKGLCGVCWFQYNAVVAQLPTQYRAGQIEVAH